MPGDGSAGQAQPPLEDTHEELGRLLDNLKEAASPPDWPAKLAEALRESRANERLLLAWLDAWQGATPG